MVRRLSGGSVGEIALLANRPLALNGSYFAGFAVYQALRLVAAVETAILHVVDIAFTTIHHWIWSVERTREKT